MSLDKNLTAATQVAMAVRKAVPRSTNNTYTNAPKLNGAVVNLGDKELMAELRMKVGTATPTTPEGWLAFAAEVKKESYGIGLGNCGELGLIACDLLRAKGVKNIEYIGVTQGGQSGPVLPHFFAAIGRTAGGGAQDHANLATPDQWGPEAVICDPWARVAYPAVNYNSFWDALHEAKREGGTLRCINVHRF